MAKIENTTVYPTVLPAADDLLIATDVSNNNKTVTFLVSSLSGGSVVNQGLQSVLDTGNAAAQAMTLTGILTVNGAPGVGYINTPQLQAAGNFGTAGQVLTSAGAGGSMTWSTPSAGGGEDIQATLLLGATTDQSMFMNGAGQSLVLSNTTDFQISGVGSDIIVGAGSNITLSDTSTLNFSTLSTISDSTGATGAAGEILTINGTGTGIEWGTLPPPSTPSLQTVLTAGLPAPANQASAVGIDFVGASTTTFSALSTINSSGTNVWSGNNTFNATGTTASTAGIALTGTLWDGASVGIAGQILSATATGVGWVNAASATVPTLQVVLGNGDTAVEDINLTGNIDLTGSLVLGANTTISANSSVGSVGQFLTATATGVEWSTFSAAFGSLDQVLNIGATSGVSIVMTGTADISAPTMSPVAINASNGIGLAGQVLSSTGTGIEWINNTGIGMTSFGIQGDTGALQTISDADTVSIAGGVGLSSVSTSTGVVTIDIDNVGTPGTYTAATITTNAQGQVTAATSNAIPIDTTYDLSSVQNGSDAQIQLVPSVGVTDSVNIEAGTNITITDTGNNIKIDAAGGSSGMTSFNVMSNGTGSTAQTITDGNQLSINGGTALTAISSVADIVTISLDDTAVVPGSYIPGNITVDPQGRITSIADGPQDLTDLSIDPIAISTGFGLTESEDALGQVTLFPFYFAGMANIGFVPDSSAVAQATHFLRADGSWEIPVSSSGVTSVNLNVALGTSTGVPLDINPTAGIVEIQMMEYAGGSNIGHVPSGGAGGEYLDGASGVWTVLPSGTGTVTSVGVAVGAGISVAMNSGVNPITGAGEFLLTNTGVIDLAIAATPYAVSTGNGLTVANIPSGTSTITPYVYDGGANVGFVPTGGLVGQYLDGTGNWVAAASAGITSLALVGITASTGFGLSISGTNAIQLAPHSYAGGTNVGFVPLGGTAGTVLDGTGAWVPQTAAGVASNTIQSGTTSTGFPISQSATTGAILWTPHEYAGGTNVGYVPTGSGGSATSYLDGSGGWSTPTDTTGVTSLITTDSAFIDLTPAATAVGAVTVTAALSATGVPDATTFLRGDNIWASPAGGGSVNSVGLSYSDIGGTAASGSPAFLVAASGSNPITGSGTFTLTGDGTGLQYVDGTGSLQTFPTIPSAYTDWNAQGDSGGVIQITDNFTLNFLGITVNSGLAGIVTDLATSPNVNIGLINNGGTPSSTTFYRGDGQWITPTMATWTLADNTNSSTISNGTIVAFTGIVGAGGVTNTLSSGGGTSTMTTTINTTGVSAGSYTNSSFTVNDQGQLTAASSGTDNNTTYDLESVQNVDDSDIKLTGSDGTTDIVKLVAGTNITLTDSGSSILIDASGNTGMSNFKLEGTSGTSEVVTDGQTVRILQGPGIATVGTNPDTITVSNTGVTSLTAISPLSVDVNNGDVTISTTVFNGTNETHTRSLYMEPVASMPNANEAYTYMDFPQMLTTSSWTQDRILHKSIGDFPNLSLNAIQLINSTVYMMPISDGECTFTTEKKLCSVEFIGNGKDVTSAKVGLFKVDVCSTPLTPGVYPMEYLVDCFFETGSGPGPVTPTGVNCCIANISSLTLAQRKLLPGEAYVLAVWNYLTDPAGSFQCRVNITMEVSTTLNP